MKRKFIILLSLIIAFSMPITAFAKPKQMPDGGWFDVTYYATMNPDVVAILGTDENILYQHYENFGAAEGRLPYDETLDSITIINPDLSYSDQDCLLYSINAINAIKEGIDKTKELKYAKTVNGIVKCANDRVDLLNASIKKIDIAIAMCNTNPKFAYCSSCLQNVKDHISIPKVDYNDPQSVFNQDIQYQRFLIYYLTLSNCVTSLASVIPPSVY